MFFRFKTLVSSFNFKIQNAQLKQFELTSPLFFTIIVPFQFSFSGKPKTAVLLPLPSVSPSMVVSSFMNFPIHFKDGSLVLCGHGRSKWGKGGYQKYNKHTFHIISVKVEAPK